jgi:lysophospholipase L1-like esterase
MFLGDSYTMGGTPDARPEDTYAAVTARILGWQVIIGGRGGTGFVAPGPAHEPFRVLFDRQLGWRPAPDMVIVSGGHNDRKYAPSRVAEAAQSLLGRIRRLWPTTRVVLLGPMWGSGAPDASVLEIRDALEVTAHGLAIPFIDPLRERWITGDRDAGTGNAAHYILRDHIHPNATGHYYLATRLVSDLRGLDLSRP